MFKFFDDFLFFFFFYEKNFYMKNFLNSSHEENLFDQLYR